MEAAVRWSPHSTGDRQRFLLLDVGDSSLTLNEVDSRGETTIAYHIVTRCTNLLHIGAFAWSPVNESLVALGYVSGHASIIRLGEEKATSKTVAEFKVKQQRKCNSVALSGESLLAVALDKTRSDVCLNIYDINNGLSDAPEPVRRLCAAELVSSVRFFPGSPQEIVASTQRSFIRLYDLRDGYFGSGNNSSSLQASTRNVNNIAIDPLDENYFASAGSTGDPSVTVWDKRWMSPSAASSGSSSGAVFNFSPAVDVSVPTTIWSLRYSGLRRGRLALCSSTGELKVIDMVEGKTTTSQSSEYLPSNPYGGTLWRTNRYVSQSRVLEAPWHDERLGKGKESRVIAFDWLDAVQSDVTQQMIILRPSRTVELLQASKSQTHAEITARQDLAVTCKDVSVLEPRTAPVVPATTPAHPTCLSSAEDFGPLNYDPDSSSSAHNNSDASVRYDMNSPPVKELLTSETLQRERCKRGYLFDCQENANMVAGNFQLERLWETVRRFRQQAADDGMVYDALDLSFVGVSGLWSEDVGNVARRTLLPSKLSVSDAIVGLNSSREIPDFEGEQTSFPEHRQLCLALCGWKFTTDTLEEECQQLIDRGLHYLAIVQAVLHDYKHIALNLLRTLIRSKTIPNIGLGALLASDTINNEQREMCLWMAADTDDPALKALLTYLTTGDWRDVMKTSYLHLGYRVALGLKYLNDTELSGFLQTETARAIRNGDLEGILLTGLGERAMDLFQSYIVKTNDLQTAVLATAFTNPRYVDDVRWEMWKETYFMQMQAWQAFNERTKFTVQHNRLAKGRDRRSLIEPPAPQLTLRCNHCSAPLVGRRGKPATTPSGVRIPGPAAHAGTVCKTCGRHLPRCAICLMWLGIPDPGTRGGVRELAKQKDNRMVKLMCFCASCGHGFHADHAKAWFDEYDMCAVPDCRCMCGLK
ncbi:hypothetical protein BAUCODRAFT_118212 [Baudoinia panamericana UAMH 10762]|uniref:Uncharacterized protein n=1 Tax=Baudoinia panamericana (strain UAMH 10762) TaxID=717646 RepID=M2NLS3_BAUPA|nr:uncharacterized protein BAUCODRAFT_118212 [Baudoinia panamericana UAMH 10762]EMD00445.1 hypothetical protein BAUCODRAFT_118212 [Baudoinia panamericana UAMH 10762]